MKKTVCMLIKGSLIAVKDLLPVVPFVLCQLMRVFLQLVVGFVLSAL